MYLLPKLYGSKAHKLNDNGKCLCGAKVKGSRSKELGDFKLCANCQDKMRGVGFGRAPISPKAIFN